MTDPADGPEIQPPDPRARGRLLIYLALGAALALAAVVVVQERVAAIRRLGEVDLEEAAAQSAVLVQALAAVVAALMLAAAALLVRLGRSIRASGRFPPPGLPVVRATRVRRGAAARRLSALAFAMAVVMLVGGAVLTGLLLGLARALGG